MSKEYDCHGCGERINEGYAIVGQTFLHKDAPWITLHAGDLTRGGLAEVSDQFNDPNTCFAKYINEDDENDISAPRVVPFNELESSMDKNKKPVDLPQVCKDIGLRDLID